MSIDPVGFLHDLVAIPSLSGQETAVAEYLVSVMNGLGMAAHIDEAGNAVGVREIPDAKRQHRTRNRLAGAHGHGAGRHRRAH